MHLAASSSATCRQAYPLALMLSWLRPSYRSGMSSPSTKNSWATRSTVINRRCDVPTGRGPRASLVTLQMSLGMGVTDSSIHAAGLVCWRCVRASPKRSSMYDEGDVMATAASQHGLGTDDTCVQKRLTRQEGQLRLVMAAAWNTNQRRPSRLAAVPDHSRSQRYSCTATVCCRG